jgi:hypothetical protein
VLQNLLAASNVMDAATPRQALSTENGRTWIFRFGVAEFILDHY